MTRFFTYRFHNGTEIQSPGLSKSEMEGFTNSFGPCIYNEWAEFMGIGRPSTLGVIGGSNTRGDGFKTGYNPALGMEIKSPGHYQKVLKEKGLQEVGNERITGSKVKQKAVIDDEIIKDARSMGAEISDREADKLTGKIE